MLGGPARETAPTSLGSGSKRAPNDRQTPSLTSRARANRSLALPPSRTTKARACLDEMAAAPATVALGEPRLFNQPGGRHFGSARAWEGRHPWRPGGQGRN